MDADFGRRAVEGISFGTVQAPSENGQGTAADAKAAFASSVEAQNR